MPPRFLDTLFPNWLWRLSPGEKRIALTFDDGPDFDTTPTLLDLLKELNVQVTFFLSGEKVRGNEMLLKRAANDGHIWANHGYHHVNHALYSRHLVRSSIQKTEEAMVAAGLRPARLFRPPFGIFRPGLTSELTHLKYRGVMWTAHLRDWKPQSDEILQRRARRAFSDGSIVLLHDKHASKSQALLKMLPLLVAEVQKQGFRFVTLCDETLA